MGARLGRHHDLRANLSRRAGGFHLPARVAERSWRPGTASSGRMDAGVNRGIRCNHRPTSRDNRAATASRTSHARLRKRCADATAPADRRKPDRPAGDDPLRDAGPHLLELPTASQGPALAALHCRRWRARARNERGRRPWEEAVPGDALGLAAELRGSPLEVRRRRGHPRRPHALRRWLDAARRARALRPIPSPRSVRPRLSPRP